MHVSCDSPLPRKSAVLLRGCPDESPPQRFRTFTTVNWCPPEYKSLFTWPFLVTRCDGSVFCEKFPRFGMAHSDLNFLHKLHDLTGSLGIEEIWITGKPFWNLNGVHYWDLIDWSRIGKLVKQQPDQPPWVTSTTNLKKTRGPDGWLVGWLFKTRAKLVEGTGRA